MASKRQQLVIADLRGGINEVDPPSSIPDKMCVEAVNVEFTLGGAGRKRQGSVSAGISSFPTAATDVAALFRHTPTAYETNTELWMIDKASTPKMGRLTASSSAWSTITPADSATQASTPFAHAISFNGKLFLAYDSAVDRLHCWDGTSLRRVGIAKPSAPSAPSEAAGSVTDNRKYRVSFCAKSGSTILYRSELSDPTAQVTLSSEKATVTKPTNPGESETHWELWAAADDTSYADYYKIGDAAIGTTTIEDNVASLIGRELAPDDGANIPPTSAKYLMVDENRLVMAGSWESDTYASRVWFTPVLGTSDVGDDERVPNTSELQNWIDINPGEGAGITGIAGPLYDTPYVFKTSQVYKLVKTGLADTPYKVVTVHKQIGCISGKSIVLGEDESGNPALYFLSQRGPYRIGQGGIEYIGLDIEQTWAGVNLSQGSQINAHGVYHHKKHQVWWWVGKSSSASPDTLLIFDTRTAFSSERGTRGGWSVYTGDVASALCSCLYAKQIGSSPLTLDLKPHIGKNAAVWRCDDDSVWTDGGTAYESYEVTKAYPLGSWNKRFRIEGLAVVAKVNPNHSALLRLRARKDYGDVIGTYDALIPAQTFPEREVVNAKEPTAYQAGPGGCASVQIKVTDDGGTAPWQLDTIVVEFSPEEER